MDDAAAIIVIGNEILTGKVVDTNSPFLVAKLRDLGMPVKRIVTIPDEIPTIAATVRELSARFQHLFTCGGVGPTLDDVTMAGLAAAFDVPLESRPELEAAIRKHFGPETQASHLKMAVVPANATLIVSESLPWPAVMVGNALVLPGDPGLLRRKFLALGERWRRAPFFVRRVYVLHEEGALSPHLDAIDLEHPGVALGSYPVYDRRDYSVLVTLEWKDEARVDGACRSLCERLDPRLIVRVE